MAPRLCRTTNHDPEPEVWFRIAYIAEVVPRRAPVATYREQSIEIAFANIPGRDESSHRTARMYGI